jgi:flagellar biosynthesis protein FlhF
MARFLDAEGFEGRVLVLNAAYDADALRSAYARGIDFGATHLVCTHLDETPRWGRLWEYLLEGRLSPLFLSMGPGLTSEMVVDVVDTVLARTLPTRMEAVAA